MLTVSQQPGPAVARDLVSPGQVFRGLILILGFLFLLVFWKQSQNGRFALYGDEHGIVRIDTRTGEVSFPVVKFPTDNSSK